MSGRSLELCHFAAVRLCHADPKYSGPQTLNVSPFDMKTAATTFPALFTRFRAGIIACVLTATSVLPAMAQQQPGAGGVGTITGRVFNPASGEYVNDAEVSIQGTSLKVYTESGGNFRFDRVPTGEITINVSYTGYDLAHDTFTLADGATVSRDINITSSLIAKGKDDEVVKLETYVVSAEREGNAKAIMAQRRSVGVIDAISTDIFGDQTEGNLGEFIKFLPGVDVEYSDEQAAGVRLGGLDMAYTGVAMDGVRLANADADRSLQGNISASAGERGVSLNQVSISNVESIEVMRTNSAEMDADAPAGTINLKSRRGFDRKSRQFAWQLSASANTEDFTLSKTYGPDSKKHRKVTPNYSITYTDVLLNRRLGISFNYSHSDRYAKRQRIINTNNYTQDAGLIETKPIIVTAIQFEDAPSTTESDAFTLTADFKASSKLVLSLTAMYNELSSMTDVRRITYTLSANTATATDGRESITSPDGDFLTSFQTAVSGTTKGVANNGGGWVIRETETAMIKPSLELKLGEYIVIDVSGVYTRSINEHYGLRKGAARVVGTNRLRVDFSAMRPSPTSQEWTITKIGDGPDWADVASYTPATIIMDDGRHVKRETYGGQIDAKFTPRLSFPIYIKVGTKYKEDTFDLRNATDWNQYLLDKVPPELMPAVWGQLRSPYDHDMGSSRGLTITNAGFPPVMDRNAMADLFKAHPEYFTHVETAATYYNSHIMNTRSFGERIMAAYGMTSMRLGPVSVQAGLRWERTETHANDYDPLTPAELLVVNPSWKTDAQGHADSIEGLNYQFFSRPKIKRKGSYDEFFPSISAKYNITQHFHAQSGYHHSIRRPQSSVLAGVWSFSNAETEYGTGYISAPNPNLKPEISDNFVARLAYYFEPVGSLTATITQNFVTDKFANKVYPIEESPFEIPSVYTGDYSAISTWSNIPGTIRYRSLELGWNQALTFLPSILKKTQVNLAYTRVYTTGNEVIANVSPHRITGSIGWGYGRFSMRFGAVWTDDTTWTATYAKSRWRKAELKCDFNANFRLTKNLSFFCTGRNIFNDPLRIVETSLYNLNATPVLQSYASYGAVWVFGLKGTF